MQINEQDKNLKDITENQLIKSFTAALNVLQKTLTEISLPNTLCNV